MSELTTYIADMLNRHDVRAYDSEILRVINQLTFEDIQYYRGNRKIKNIDLIIKKLYNK